MKMQKIGLIRNEVNEANFYSLYAQAHALRCESLIEDLRELCITSLLNPRTALKTYNDVVEHKDVQIMEACVAIILDSFEEICEDVESAKE